MLDPNTICGSNAVVKAKDVKTRAIKCQSLYKQEFKQSAERWGRSIKIKDAALRVNKEDEQEHKEEGLTRPNTVWTHRCWQNTGGNGKRQGAAGKKQIELPETDY